MDGVKVWVPPRPLSANPIRSGAFWIVEGSVPASSCMRSERILGLDRCPTCPNPGLVGHPGNLGVVLTVVHRRSLTRTLLRTSPRPRTRPQITRRSAPWPSCMGRHMATRSEINGTRSLPVRHSRVHVRRFLSCVAQQLAEPPGTVGAQLWFLGHRRLECAPHGVGNVDRGTGQRLRGDTSVDCGQCPLAIGERWAALQQREQCCAQ